MNLPSVAILAACLLACGCCRHPRVDVYIEALNAEKRALEDQIYELEYECELAAQELAAYRGEDDQRRGRPERPTTDAGGQKEQVDDAYDLVPPSIEPGVPELPDIELPMSPPDSAPDSPPGRAADSPPDRAADSPPPNAAQGEGPVQLEPSEPADTRVARIVLNPRYTGGESFDERPGDEGVSVLIEPRNTAGQLVPVAGPISIAVLDPAKEGDEARVARWDVDSLEADGCLRQSGPQRGIRWRGRWTGDPPDNGKLLLFVRFGTDDGRELRADQEILVTPPGQLSRRWTPRRSDRDSARPQDADRVAHQRAAGREPPVAPSLNDADPPTNDAAQQDDQAERPRPQWRPYR
jgi:hypothetical protein